MFFFRKIDKLKLNEKELYFYKHIQSSKLELKFKIVELFSADIYIPLKKSNFED